MGKITSRIGLESDAIPFGDNFDFYAHAKHAIHQYSCLLGRKSTCMLRTDLLEYSRRGSVSDKGASSTAIEPGGRLWYSRVGLRTSNGLSRRTIRRYASADSIGLMAEAMQALNI